MAPSASVSPRVMPPRMVMTKARLVKGSAQVREQGVDGQQQGAGDGHQLRAYAPWLFAVSARR
jgi:hypothetical protein